jgi:pimeloyl-ACP methyl ester carboxylesterase
VPESRWCRSLDLGKVHLVGHSMGGMVAVELARSNPDMLRTLTLADPAGPVSLLGDEVAQQRREAGAKFAQMVRTRLDTGDRRVAAQSMWDTISGPGAWDRAPPTVQQMMVDNVGTAAAPPDRRRAAPLSHRHRRAGHGAEGRPHHARAEPGSVQRGVAG